MKATDRSKSIEFIYCVSDGLRLAFLTSEKNGKSADYVRRKILFVDQYLFRIRSIVKQRSEHFCY